MNTNEKLDQQRKFHDANTKRLAVSQWVNGEKAGKQIASDLRISYWTLREWKKKFYCEVAGEDTSQSVAKLTSENRRLLAETFLLRKECETLKNALTIMARS